MSVRAQPQARDPMDKADIRHEFHQAEKNDTGNSGTIEEFAVAGSLLVLIALFIGFGYWHLVLRRRKGLEPLRYHAWMIKKNRPRPPMCAPQPRRPTYLESTRSGAAPPQEYKMTAWVPPPTYNTDIPPAYNAEPTATSAPPQETPLPTSNDPPLSTSSPTAEETPMAQGAQQPTVPASAVLSPTR